MSSSIIARIQKLRALASSDNLHEAAAAARLAEKLLQDYALSEADVSQHPDELAETPDHEDAITWGKAIPAWQNILSASLAKQYECSPIRTTSPTRAKVLRVFGRRADIETFKYQYAFYTAEITRLCNKLATGKGRSYRASFCHGAVIEITAALAAARSSARATATGSALVRVDQRAELAKLARNAAFPQRSSSRASHARNYDGYHAGKQAGGTIRSGGALGAGGVRLLGV